MGYEGIKKSKQDGSHEPECIHVFLDYERKPLQKENAHLFFMQGTL
jgi:hypothetical protein